MNPGTSGLARGLRVLQALAGDEASAAGGLGVVRVAELVSAGHALAVDLEPADLDELGLASIAGDVGAVRLTGHAVVVDGFEPGLTGVAAPVRDYSGGVAAAINISGPTFRLEPRLEEA